jgi:DNA-binding IclR family transcriptional regulator
LRQQILAHLSAGRAAPTNRTLADTIGLPTSIVGRVCEDLAALGVLQRRSDLDDHERRWSLSPQARTLMEAAGLQPTEVA